MDQATTNSGKDDGERGKWSCTISIRRATTWLADAHVNSGNRLRRWCVRSHFKYGAL